MADVGGDAIALCGVVLCATGLIINDWPVAASGLTIAVGAGVTLPQGFPIHPSKVALIVGTATAAAALVCGIATKVCAPSEYIHSSITYALSAEALALGIYKIKEAWDLRPKAVKKTAAFEQKALD
jgi:hypothetical protein